MIVSDRDRNYIYMIVSREVLRCYNLDQCSAGVARVIVKSFSRCGAEATSKRDGL